MKQKSVMQNLKDNKESFSSIVLSILVSIYIFTVLKYTSIMPIEDDYGAVLRFLNDYLNIENTLDKFKLLFSQHMEHRIVFNRLVELLQFKVFGEVNFIYLTLFGNLGWLLIVYILWSYSKKNNFITLFSFMPIALMMLAFSHSSLMTWAMASIQQYWQLLFSILTIFFLTHNRTYIAYTFMIIAIFTGGGGLALIPIVGLYYLVHRNWKQLIVTLLLSISVVYFYFIVLDFHKLSDSMSMLLVTFKHNYMLLFYYIFAFLGNFVEHTMEAIYVGGTFVLLFLIRAKTFFKQIPFIAWSILFIFSIALLTGLSRSMFGPDQAMSSRYSIYSVLLASFIYLAYLRVYTHSRVLLIMGLFIGSWVFVYSAIKRVPLFEYRSNMANTALAHPNKRFAKDILLKSYNQGTFTKWKEKIELP